MFSCYLKITTISVYYTIMMLSTKNYFSYQLYNRIIDICSEYFDFFRIWLANQLYLNFSEYKKDKFNLGREYIISKFRR